MIHARATATAARQPDAGDGAAASNSTTARARRPLSSLNTSSNRSSGRHHRHHHRRRRPVVAAAAATSNPNNTPQKDPQRDSWDEEEDDGDAELRAQAEAEAAAERAVEKLLEPAWRGLKEAAQRELASSAADGDGDAERAAQRLTQMSLTEALEGDRLLKSLAESELGPVLESLGLPRSQALPFLYDLVRTAAAVQLATAALVFYGAEFFFGLDSGEAWRCVCGLGVGYLARLVIPVESLAWPLYDWLVRAATGGRGYYRAGGLGEGEEGGEGQEGEGRGGGRGAAAAGGGGARGAGGGAAQQQQQDEDDKQSTPPRPPSQREQARAALTRLGFLFAGCALLPPLVLGWGRDASAFQFAFPALAGALAFDAAYLVALVLKLREAEDGGGQE